MKKRFRFSIFFRGCNQYKFIHITPANINTFFRQGSLYLKKFIKLFWLIPEIYFRGFAAVLLKLVKQADY